MGRPNPRLRLRPIPTTDTATPELATDVDTDTLVLATAVDTPALDTPDSATAVDTPPLDTLDSADTPVATPDLATEATPVLEGSTASVRLSPRLRLRPIPTTDTDTPDLATLASGATEDMAVDTPALDTPDLATTVDTLDSATDTAVATDTSDKKDPVLHVQRLSRPAQSRTIIVECLNWQCQCSQIPDCRIFLASKESEMK